MGDGRMRLEAPFRRRCDERAERRRHRWYFHGLGRADHRRERATVGTDQTLAADTRLRLVTVRDVRRQVEQEHGAQQSLRGAH